MSKPPYTESQPQPVTLSNPIRDGFMLGIGLLFSAPFLALLGLLVAIMFRLIFGG
jgi:hypothetical protein